MSDTKIVIDKDEWNKIASEFNSDELPPYTEIQIDQSIEAAAIEFQYTIQNGASQSDIIQMLLDFATQQQIIEQLKVKGIEDEKFTCTNCGSNKTYKTEAYHCNMCAMTTEI